MPGILERLFKGREVPSQVETIVEEEIAEAAEDYRPQIRKLVKAQMKATFDQLAEEYGKEGAPCLLDMDDIKEHMNDATKEAFETYEDEIGEAISEVVIEKIKDSTIKLGD